MKRMASLVLLCLVVGILIHFRQEVIGLLREGISPKVILEEDICGRVGGGGIAAADYSLDAGATWQDGASDGQACRVYLALDPGGLAQRSVLLRLQRSAGRYELWQITPGGERLLSASKKPIMVEKPGEASAAGSIWDALELESLGWGSLAAVALVSASLFLLLPTRAVRELAEIRRLSEQTNFLLQKVQRKAVELSALPGGVPGWIASRVQEGFGVHPQLEEGSIMTLERQGLILAISREGYRMVISPHTKKALLDRFGGRGRRSSLERLSAQAQALEVVRRGKVVRHCLGGSGETFDIEARLLAEALDFSWGQPDFLYFYALFQG